jgi:hypothetical protein
MSITSGKVLLLRLYEKQSARGNRYWIGRLGAAKVVAFPNTEIELQFGAVGAIDVFVQTGSGDTGGGNRPDTPMVPSAGVQHWKRPLAEELAEEPPLDDDVSGLWRDP